MKRLFLVRHGSRDTFDRSQDNGLNAKGKKQADLLLSTLGARFKKGEKVSVVSSPKARCRETVTPLAEHLGLKVDVEKRLDERVSDEDARHFAQRIKSFFEEWKKATAYESLVACSHGDLIPWLMDLATGQATDFEKATWAEIELKADGSIKIVSINRTAV